MKCDFNSPFAFISYSHDEHDAQIVMNVFKKLYEKGYNLWIDTANMPHDEKSWKRAARTALMKKTCVLALYFRSETSMIKPTILKELETIDIMKHIERTIVIDIWQNTYMTADKYRNEIYNSGDEEKAATCDDICEYVSVNSNAIRLSSDFENNIYKLVDEIADELTAVKLSPVANRTILNNSSEYRDNETNNQESPFFVQTFSKDEAIQYIKDNKAKIDSLMNEKRFEEVEQLYNSIVPLAEKYLVELSVIYDYADYLYNQNKNQQALQVAQKLERIYIGNPQLADDSELARLYNLLGCINSGLNLYDKSEKYYKSAINIYEDLVKTNPEMYNPVLAISYNNMGVLYCDQHNYAQAEKYYLLAIKIQEELGDILPHLYRWGSMSQEIRNDAIQIFYFVGDNCIGFDYNPARRVTIPKNSVQNERRSLTEKEIGLVLKLQHKARPAVLIMMLCGLRVGEMLPLRWDDIDFENKIVHINKSTQRVSGNEFTVKKGTKNGKNRNIPIPSTLVDELMETKTLSKSPYICSNSSGIMHTPSSWKRIFESYIIELNALNNNINKYNPNFRKSLDKITAHMLRHTYASMLYFAGVDVLTAQKLLGHSDVSTTVNVKNPYEQLKESKQLGFVCDSGRGFLSAVILLS